MGLNLCCDKRPLPSSSYSLSPLNEKEIKKRNKLHKSKFKHKK